MYWPSFGQFHNFIFFKFPKLKKKQTLKSFTIFIIQRPKRKFCWGWSRRLSGSLKSDKYARWCETLMHLNCSNFCWVCEDINTEDTIRNNIWSYCDETQCFYLILNVSYYLTCCLQLAIQLEAVFIQAIHLNHHLII